MTALAPALSRFLREHLPRDQRASPLTCDAYAYSFQLLVIFAARQLQKTPSQLEVEDIGVPMILSFLEHIERDRGDTPACLTYAAALAGYLESSSLRITT